MAQREDIIRRTVYVSDIDQQVYILLVLGLVIFVDKVVDCRICGDPNSVLRFAFIEFTDEDGAQTALNLSGTMLGYYPVKVLPSKTAIAPVNPTFLPRNDDEREMCTRTIYCTNIDKKVTQSDIKVFFESVCGEVSDSFLL
ncbi:Polyadenylate-binding protein-interacting protein 11 [Linum perenne]